MSHDANAPDLKVGPTYTRREALAIAVAVPFAAAVRPAAAAELDLKSLMAASSGVMTPRGPGAAGIQVERQWDRPFCRARVVNRSSRVVQLSEVVLADLRVQLTPATRVYGEGFQMLSATGGTIGEPIDLSQYTDSGHYKLPAPPGARVYYGMLTLTPPGEDTRLLAFTSCRRFAGQVRTSATSIQVVVDTEGLDLPPDQTLDLEEFAFFSGADRAKLLADLGDRLARNHPPLRTSAPPTGWCSWYCFGPKVTARQVLDNLDAIARTVPGLKYIQIDDGYQPAMGDWLETGAAFGGDVQSVLKAIRARGFEPAIWVAPFIAEAGSHVFQQHPEWFVKDADGKPLRADRVTFGGWRRGPWYALDGTHPAVQEHLERVFRTMRREWGCTYFKLDANFWGTLPGGTLSDPHATRIEAYRRGMEAVIKGAGDSFILGCNHPLWPSLGLIHGSRSSNDIRRTADRIISTARQNLSRAWQNGRLWWNDPDAVVLSGELPDDILRFHATAIYASGGMVLSGDDLTTLPAGRLAMLKKLLPPTGVPARFEDETLRVGTVDIPGVRMLCLFNWDDAPQTLTVRLPRPVTVTDYWTGDDLGRHEGTLKVGGMLPKSARLLACR